MCLEKAEIAALIPHGESMSLLDSVDAWDDQSIRCRTASHRCDSNPLLEKQTLDSCILIEYAAQAAAVHAGLVHSSLGHQRAAYVGAVKSVKFTTNKVPMVDELIIDAQSELQNDGGAIYYFRVNANNEILAEGRLILVQPD